VIGAEVEKLVLEEIGSDWSRTNAHGVELKRCLLLPPKEIRCVWCTPHEDGPEEFDGWLVLEENPGQEIGYLIIFHESSGKFGLAFRKTDSLPVYLGHDGDFLTTLGAM
jgi:hypothetical protein